MYAITHIEQLHMQALIKLNTLSPKSSSRQAGTASIRQENSIRAFPHTHSQEEAKFLVNVEKREKFGPHYSQFASQELWVPESHRTGGDYTDFADSHTPNN